MKLGGPQPDRLAEEAGRIWRERLHYSSVEIICEINHFVDGGITAAAREESVKSLRDATLCHHACRQRRLPA